MTFFLTQIIMSTPLEMNKHFGNDREKIRVAGEQYICIKDITDDGTGPPVKKRPPGRNVITV